MIVLFKGIKQSNIMIFDAEYNEGKLIQFSGFLFRKIQEDIFQVEKSFTTYVKLDEGCINPFIRDFTGIDDGFLAKNGISLDEARKQIYNFMDVGDNELLIVSHGIYNDRQTLLNNDVDFYVDKNGKEIQGICTYNAARRLLKRDKDLTLTDIAAESGIFLSNGHNSFNDAMATISVFCLMCKLEEESKNERKQKVF